MRVKTTDLRRACELLLCHLEATEQPEFEISDDYYWSIHQDEAYNPKISPSDMTLGQLSDDWGEIRALLDGQREPVGYALVWLASILKKIGEQAST